ncbi:YqgE/AlgH family protein [Camelimonas abortus]|uniref:UPF0301 protein ACFOEX_06945 n=1 Tax=Camelimonas abortus TaxID=1017184 RepID=A0ABV7LDT4_9HYPH
MARSIISPSERSDVWLDGQMLVATPSMQDERFARSVIYLCAHSDEGAMGLVVNKPARGLSLADLLRQLEIIDDASIRLPSASERVKVVRGGPVDVGRGFVLHSSDFAIDNSTLHIDDDISLTATVDILRAIARGDGPGNAIVALGYAGWAAGQLEQEIQANGWFSCPADPALIFGRVEDMYERALAMIGVDPLRLSDQAGHA